MSKRKVSLWANRFNLAGLWSRVPVQVFWNDACGCFYDRGGNLNVHAIGTWRESGHTTFAHTEQAIAQAWTDGVLAAGDRLAAMFPKPRRGRAPRR